jgi:hypothetical protein
MKKISFIATVFLFAAIPSFAQKQSGSLPYNKEKLDSLCRSFPKLQQQPFALPSPKGYSLLQHSVPENPGSFETTNPGTVMINKTNRGIVYNMSLDNMAVLVPDMSGTERMPVSGYSSKIIPADKMPNPLYHRNRQPAEIK